MKSAQGNGGKSGEGRRKELWDKLDEWLHLKETEAQVGIFSALLLPSANLSSTKFLEPSA